MTEPARPTRRSFLRGAVGGSMAAVAAALSQVLPTRAKDGEALTLGTLNETSSATRLARSTSGPALVVDAAGPGVAVAGTAASGIAVYGLATTGNGVLGSSESGTGVEAASDRGIALRVARGRVRLDGISGVARIVAGDVVAFVMPAAAVMPDAIVMLTPMTDLGGRDVWFRLRPDANGFAIHLAAPSDADVDIGWLMLG